MKTETNELIEALENMIRYDDDINNHVLREAAQRLNEQQARIDRLERDIRQHIKIKKHYQFKSME